MAADLHDLRRPDAPYSETIDALAECHEDALSEAACGGLLDPNEVTDWAVRTQRLVLFERDRSALRSEVPALAERLGMLLGQVDVAEGVERDEVVRRTIGRLPAVRGLLAEDVAAAYAGDPAARTYDEIVVAYPSVLALSIFRLAHELHVQGVALLPRIMTEYAHSRTGIDIHPGATIGHHFFIDHGTGVVIGETAQIGERVRVYQGVTIGAASVRDSDDLRSIDPKRTPREIDSLVNALNRLFRRLEEALDRERDFTDNAAHELRTPLAAIKTQAQALRPRLQTMPDCSESLANLLASVDRAWLLESFDVNCAGPLLVTRALRAALDARKRRYPSYVASLSARVGSINDNGLGGWYSYRGSKAAQNMATRTMAIELRRQDTRCVALHPGTTETALSAPFARNVRPEKLFPAPFSAKQLLDICDGLKDRHSGAFFGWDGEAIDF